MDRLTFVQSLIGQKPVLRHPANEPKASLFIEVIHRSRPIVIRRLDWRINVTHIARQVATRHATVNLRRDLPDNARDVVRGGPPKYQGTYVDFEEGIKWCRELELHNLADQLLQLKPITNEGAADVE